MLTFLRVHYTFGAPTCVTGFAVAQSAHSVAFRRAVLRDSQWVELYAICHGSIPTLASSDPDSMSVSLFSRRSVSLLGSIRRHPEFRKLRNQPSAPSSWPRRGVGDKRDQLSAQITSVCSVILTKQRCLLNGKYYGMSENVFTSFLFFFCFFKENFPCIFQEHANKYVDL